MFSCSYCSYNSKRKFCVKRHENSIHFTEKYDKPTIIEEEFKELIIEKTKEIYNCSKCDKEYLTLKSLKSHEEKCIGIDILTCQKCMKTFSSFQSKSDHKKRNNCKAVSIITLRTNIIVNNYGKERLDYFTPEKMLQIIYSDINAIPTFIRLKHFNKDFPENNNILYEKSLKQYKIKENNDWIYLNIDFIANKLYNDSITYLLKYHNYDSDLLMPFLNNINETKTSKLILKEIKNQLKLLSLQ